MARVMVAGAGISGLALAYALRWRHTELPSGLELTVVDPAPAPGGAASSEMRGGGLLSRGPECFAADAPAALALAQRLGLSPTLRRAHGEAAALHLWDGEALTPMPRGAADLKRLSGAGAGARARLAMRGLRVPPAPGIDEPLSAFLDRQLGPELGAVLARALSAQDALGDPDALSAKALRPDLVARAEGVGLLRAGLAAVDEREASEAGGRRGGILEQISGLVAANTAEAGMRRFQGAGAGAGEGVVAFDGGMSRLTGALAHALGDRVRAGVGVTAVTGAAAGRSGPWQVRLSDGSVAEADGLCLAVPPWAAASILEGLDSALAAALRAIPAARVLTVSLRYPVGDAPRLPGRGYLVGGGALRHRQASWLPAALRPQDARAVWVRLAFGGPMDDGVHELADDALTALAVSEAGQVLGGAAPAEVILTRDAARIPQPTAGHEARLAEVERRLALHPGLALTGPGWRGLTVPDVLRHVGLTSDRLVFALRHVEGRQSGAPHPRRG